MFDLLNCYNKQGCLKFTVDDNLNRECEKAQIPNDCCGVYIVYGYFKGMKIPVYIGSSGHIENGKTVHRKGGLKRRIIGRQQKTPRWKLWPEKMRALSICELEICWYNTENDNPLLVEYCLILESVIKNKRLPLWNSELKLSRKLKGEFEDFVNKKNIECLKIKI